MPIKSRILFLLLAPSLALANDWGIKTPWDEPSVPAPEIQPSELPTLRGEAAHYNHPAPALQPAPKVNPDDIFATVLSCYPEKSKFKLDLNLVAGMKCNLDEYNSDDWPEISEHYVGIVGKMPLYSTTEQARERQWEYQRRTATASSVAAFTQSLAERNYSYRIMGLYLALEARAQKRIEQGVTGVNEQISLLEKVASAHRDVLTHEAKIVEHRLALVSLCEDSYSEQVNFYLQKLAYLPLPESPVNEVAQP